MKINVLLMGFRVGAAKALEERKIPYSTWTEKPILDSRKSQEVIFESFSDISKSFEKYESILKNITHVISLTESAVIPGSIIREKLNLFRNSKSAIRRCTDKLKMKEFLYEKKIPMTKFLSHKNQTPELLATSLGLPMMAKLKLSSGGRGVFFINDQEKIEKYLTNQYYFEKCVSGSEGSVESLIQDRKIIFSNITEYYKNGECNLIPCHFSEEMKKKILKLNEKVISALNIKWGMTHLEYFKTEDDILFGEVALRPPGGYIMDGLTQSYGENFWDTFIGIELLENNFEKKKLTQYSCTIIIHPGEGEVESIQGEEAVQKLKSKIKYKLKIKVGDKLSKREGVGQDYGHLILSNESKDILLSDIKKFYHEFKINLKKNS